MYLVRGSGIAAFVSALGERKTIWPRYNWSRTFRWEFIVIRPISVEYRMDIGQEGRQAGWRMIFACAIKVAQSDLKSASMRFVRRLQGMNGA